MSNRNQNRKKKQVAAGAIALSVVLAGSNVWSFEALAAESSKTKDTGKEEVVYIMTDASGKTTSLNVVNIFGAGDITDYGDYSRVKMLTSTEEIKQSGDKVTFHSDADKVYYQGTMDTDTEIPWDISITYTLDGKTVTPEELAGSKGSLDIHIVIADNENCEGDFYENYALQASFTLDTGLCKNIKAENATLANVGADKQITYTVLPGKGLDAHITADVKNFEMDAVSINGIQMNLDVEIDDDELMDKVREIMDATADLNDGADDLQGGVSDLRDGASELLDGASDLYDGTADLYDGAADLRDGVSSLQSGLGTLNENSGSLTSGSSQMKSALSKLKSSLDGISVSTSDVSTLVSASSQVKDGLGSAESGAETLKDSVNSTAWKSALSDRSKGQLDVDTLQGQNEKTIANLTTMLQNGGDSLSSEQKELYQNLIALLTANSGALSGTAAYLDQAGQGAASLASGLSDLNNQYAEFDAGIQQTASTLSDMASGMESLKSGVNTIVSSYDSLDSGISSYTSGVSSAYTGSGELLNGAGELLDGASELKDGAGDLKDGASELYDGVVELYDGTEELQDGTSEFYDKTYDMDTQVQDEIDEMLSSITGDDTETVSFVSAKNTDVDAVQFIIKTDAIEIPEEEAEEVAVEETKSIWQKFLDLFR